MKTIRQTSDLKLLTETAQDSRRRFLQQAGTATFSGLAIALLGGRSTALAWVLPASPTRVSGVTWWLISAVLPLPPKSAAKRRWRIEVINPAVKRIPPGPDDEALLAEVLSGSLESFEGIMRHHNQRLYRLARSIVTDDAEAMDVVQEAFITAYRRLADLKEPAALGTWLARITRNAALMRLRGNRRYQFMEESDLDNVLEMSVTAPRQLLPEREAANMQLKSLLEECIDELPDVFRAVFMLRAVEQCSVDDTAEILEIPQATVKTRFHRARRLMQQRILDYAEAAGIGVHEMAGPRCDAIVRNVMATLRTI